MRSYQLHILLTQCGQDSVFCFHILIFKVFEFQYFEKLEGLNLRSRSESAYLNILLTAYWRKLFAKFPEKDCHGLYISHVSYL